MIKVHIRCIYRPFRPQKARLEALVRAVCKQMASTSVFVDLTVVDGSQMRHFNSRLTSRQGATDCLSLDLSDEHDATRVLDIIVNGQLAVQRARIYGIRPISELALYIVHGLLHQFGFDDKTRDQARSMHMTEDRILQSLGYGRVYYAPMRSHGC